MENRLQKEVAELIKKFGTPAPKPKPPEGLSLHLPPDSLLRLVELIIRKGGAA